MATGSLSSGCTPAASRSPLRPSQQAVLTHKSGVFELRVYLGSNWGSFGGSVWGRVGTVLESIWVRFRDGLGPVSGRFEAALGSSLGWSGMNLATV